MNNRLYSAFIFALPLLCLLVVWEFCIRFFNVDARVFPSIQAVFTAGLESISDGTIFQHIAASLGRVAVGTALAILVSIPLGVAMGLNPVVSDFLSPLFRFFSVLAGIAWIPIATLWFGYGFGAITFVILNAVFLSSLTTHCLAFLVFPCPCGMRRHRWARMDGP